MRAIGIRELRQDLAAQVRRAGAGDRVTISVAGRPAAVMAPVAEEPNAAGPSLSTMVASGAVVAPRRQDGGYARSVIPVWGNVRLDRLLREIRG